MRTYRSLGFNFTKQTSLQNARTEIFGSAAVRALVEGHDGVMTARTLETSLGIEEH